MGALLIQPTLTQSEHYIVKIIIYIFNECQFIIIILFITSVQIKIY